MQTWMRFGIGAAAIALAIAAGTAAYAMRGDNDQPARQATNQTATTAADNVADEDAAGGTFAAMCVEDQPDCDDTVDVPIGDFGTYRCLPEAVDCVDTFTCVTTLPAPIVGGSSEIDPAFSGTAEDLPLADEDVDEGLEPVPGLELTAEEQARLEDEQAREIALCTQPEECVPGPAVDCGPVDPCVPGPAVDCGPVDCLIGPAGECLAPDCAISSDGAISCPTESCLLPGPGVAEETIVERCNGVACASAGSDPTAPQTFPETDQVANPPASAAPCPLAPPSGGVTDVPPPTGAGVPEPAPVE